MTVFIQHLRLTPYREKHERSALSTLRRFQIKGNSDSRDCSFHISIRWSVISTELKLHQNRLLNCYDRNFKSNCEFGFAKHIHV